MKRVFGCLLIWLALSLELCLGMEGSPEGEALQPVSNILLRRSAVEVPLHRLARIVSPLTGSEQHAMRFASPWGAGKVRFSPVKILGRARQLPPPTKKLPRCAGILLRHPDSPAEPIKRPHIGLVLDLETAYGNENTVIGRVQHGTQFKGAYYTMDGHWEKTDGIAGGKPEETLATALRVDWDLSKNLKVFLDSSYLQSTIALPQLPTNHNHEKSDLQATLSSQLNLNPDITAAWDVSWERARFLNHEEMAFNLNQYGSKLTLKQLWGKRNLLSLQATGAWEEFLQAEHPAGDRYYGSAIVTNSFAVANQLSFDLGIRGDYYDSEQGAFTDRLFSPILTTRLHLLSNTTIYGTYQPRIIVPQFTDLYIRKLYTTVNPDLHSAKEYQYLESGLKQRFGEAFALNIDLFYHDTEGGIFQIDANSDHILEYEQVPSVDFLGVRANLQMNYREQLVQDITYTYTKHHIFSEQRFEETSEEFRNQIITYLPNHQVQASLYWKLPFGLTLKVNGTYVSEQFQNRSREQGLIGKRFFVNAEATQNITNNVQVFLIGRNLTDVNTYDIIPLLDSAEITSSRLIAGGIRIRF